MVNLEYYRVFCYVARCQSITRAAEALHITQPAVSQAIRHLEDALGGTLFVRTSRGVRLTTESEVLYAGVASGYDRMAQAESHYRSLLDLETGDVRIGASDMTLRFFLLDRLEIFTRQYPGIRVHITDATTPETLDALKDGRIDFGVVTTPLDQDPALHTRTMAPFRDIPVAGPHFHSLCHRPVSLSELNEQPLICLDTQTRTRHSLDTFWRSHGQVLNPAFELASSSLILAFALKNLGIGLVAEPYARDALAAGTLFPVRLDTPLPSREMALVTHARNPLSPAGRRLLDMLSI